MSTTTNEIEAAEDLIIRHIRVASTLLRQAVTLVEKVQLQRATDDHRAPLTVDPHLIAELQLSTTALRRGLERCKLNV